MNIVRRDEVLEDLINLSYYIAQNDEQAANRFLDAVAESFERLAQMPLIGVPAHVSKSATDRRSDVVCARL